MKDYTKLFEVFESLNPEPQTELYYSNPYTLLVAVMLSAQATDKGVNKATEPLFQKISTPQEMVSFGIVALTEALKSLNYYKTKAKNVIATSQDLIEKHNGVVPSNRKELEALPGVGRKTANVVLNVAFHENTIPVDTHIFRVAKRLGLSHGNTPLQVELDLEKNVPSQYLNRAHHWLILHGRYQCKAQKPLCETCPVKNFCEFYSMIHKNN